MIKKAETEINTHWLKTCLVFDPLWVALETVSPWQAKRRMATGLRFYGKVERGVAP